MESNPGISGGAWRIRRNLEVFRDRMRYLSIRTRVSPPVLHNRILPERSLAEGSHIRRLLPFDSIIAAQFHICKCGRSPEQEARLKWSANVEGIASPPSDPGLAVPSSGRGIPQCTKLRLGRRASASFGSRGTQKVGVSRLQARGAGDGDHCAARLDSRQLLSAPSSGNKQHPFWDGGFQL